MKVSTKTSLAVMLLGMSYVAQNHGSDFVKGHANNAVGFAKENVQMALLGASVQRALDKKDLQAGARSVVESAACLYADHAVRRFGLNKKVADLVKYAGLAYEVSKLGVSLSVLEKLKKSYKKRGDGGANPQPLNSAEEN